MPATAAQLRDSAIKTLQEHSQDMFELDVLHTQLSQDYQETDSPLFSYCEKMKQDGTYADKIKIAIIQHDNTCITVSAYSNDEFVYPITIGSIRDVHFVAVREL